MESVAVLKEAIVVEPTRHVMFSPSVKLKLLLFFPLQSAPTRRWLPPKVRYPVFVGVASGCGVGLIIGVFSDEGSDGCVLRYQLLESNLNH